MEENLLNLLKEMYPVDFTKIEKITGEMYQLEGENDIYYARITNYRPYEMQQEEVSWTNFLGQMGLGVSPTILSKEGNLVEKIKFPEEKTAVLYKAAEGTHLPREKWDAGIFKELGGVIGRLHQYTKEYHKERTNFYLKHWYEDEEFNFLKYIPEEETTIRKIAHRVLSEIKNLPRDENNYGLIHGDIWLENTLVTGENKITLIDFQDCEYHYFLFDLAVPIYSAMEFSFMGGSDIEVYRKDIILAIINGYREANPVDMDFFKDLPLFLKLKEIFEYSLMHMYWDGDSLTEEQVRIMNLYRMKLEKDLDKKD